MHIFRNIGFELEIDPNNGYTGYNRQCEIGMIIAIVMVNPLMNAVVNNEGAAKL